MDDTPTTPPSTLKPLTEVMADSVEQLQTMATDAMGDQVPMILAIAGAAVLLVVVWWGVGLVVNARRNYLSVWGEFRRRQEWKYLDSLPAKERRAELKARGYDG